MRKKIIAGNYKMNLTASQVTNLLKEIKNDIDTDKVDVVVCPNYLAIPDACRETEGTNISVGVQNIFYEEKGAYTGETSCEMIKDLGVKYAIIGHSERRQYFNETDNIVNKKVKKAIEQGIFPIMCVGESLTQREEGIYLEFVKSQVENGLATIDDISSVIIAYEPIWAIGTGKTATDEQAEEMCLFIRNVIKIMYGEEVSDKIRIQYGGSVNKENASKLLNMENIDGALVGGASIKKDFIDIVNF